VDDVVREDERNAQPRLFDRDALQPAGDPGAVDREEGADLAAPYLRLALGSDRGSRRTPVARVLRELPHLLRHRHPRDQRIDEGFVAPRLRFSIARQDGQGEGREKDGTAHGGQPRDPRLLERRLNSPGERPADRAHRLGATLKIRAHLTHSGPAAIRR
jgi:hypothetical protein